MTGIELTPGSWILITALGTVLGLDAISWPQAMISRPIVAGTLGGVVFGDPAAGFLAGAWLELLAARHPPFGAARYPETGPSALIAGAAYALSDSGSVPALAAAVLVGWTIGWVGMHGIARLRSFNAGLIGDVDAVGGSPDEIARRHRLGIRLDAVRAAVISGALFVPAALVVRWLERRPAGDTAVSLSAHLALLGLAALGGVSARVLGGRRRRWPVFLAGGLVGLLLVWWTP